MPNTVPGPREAKKFSSVFAPKDTRDSMYIVIVTKNVGSSTG